MELACEPWLAFTLSQVAPHATRPPAKPNRITRVLRLYSNLHFGVADHLFGFLCVSQCPAPRAMLDGYCWAASWRAHSLWVQARAPHSPAVSSILS